MPRTEFIVRARAAPVQADPFLNAVGRGNGVENLADILRNALFVAQSHRGDTVLSIVLERSQDFSRIVTIDGMTLGTIENLHETALLGVIAQALRAGEKLGKNEVAVDSRGVSVRAASFEQLLKEKTTDTTTAMYLLDRKGSELRDRDLTGDVVFVMTDHTPMPPKSSRALLKQGLEPLSIGPRMLHASQCITILLNEVDRQRF